MQAIHQYLRETHIIGSGSREWRLAVEACAAMAPCQILYAGWTDATAGYRFVRRNPPFHGLLVCDGGRGRVLVDGRWRDCPAGQAYLLPSGVLHAYHATRRWRICWIAFQPRGDLAPGSGRPQLVPADPRPVRAALEGLQREVNGVADAAAVQQWVGLIRLYGLRIAGAQHEEARLFGLWEQVDADLAHAWTLAELSDLAGASQEHLRRLCQRQLGGSPMAHLAKLRMRRAAALLISGSQKVAAVARTVGYENPFAFSTCFRRHFGISPARYRGRPQASS